MIIYKTHENHKLTKFEYIYSLFLMLSFKPAPGKIVKSKFTPEEDKKLIELVNNSPDVDWNKIAAQFTNRNPRQCRERWQNYLNPALSSNNWTEEEDQLILERFKEMGPHWNAIGRTFVGRSGNAVRNRYLVLMRHQQKKFRLNKFNEYVPLQENPMMPMPILEPIQQNFIAQQMYAQQMMLAYQMNAQQNNFQFQQQQMQQMMQPPQQMQPIQEPIMQQQPIMQQAPQMNLNVEHEEEHPVKDVFEDNNISEIFTGGDDFVFLDSMFI